MYRFCISILLMSSVFFSTSYAEDWVCVDNGDNSVYKVKISDEVVEYIYPDNEGNRTFKVYPHGREDIVYAMQPLRLTKSSERFMFCQLCFVAELVAIDKKYMYVHHVSVNYGFKYPGMFDFSEKEETYVGDDYKLASSSWTSRHKCQIDF